MNIAVLIKMVPDTESKLEVNDGALNDQNFKYMVNPYDEFAVEQAVQRLSKHFRASTTIPDAKTAAVSYSFTISFAVITAVFGAWL